MLKYKDKLAVVGYLNPNGDLIVKYSKPMGKINGQTVYSEFAHTYPNFCSPIKGMPNCLCFHDIGLLALLEDATGMLYYPNNHSDITREKNIKVDSLVGYNSIGRFSLNLTDAISCGIGLCNWTFDIDAAINRTQFVEQAATITKVVKPKKR
jgi:hypothetical protein